MNNKLKVYQEERQKLSTNLTILIIVEMLLFMAFPLILIRAVFVFKIILSFIIISAFIIILKHALDINNKIKLLTSDLWGVVNSYLKDKGNFRFIGNNFLTEEQFYENGFLNKTRGNNFSCSDTLIGSNFSSSLVNVNYEESNDDSTTTITLFHGRYYEIDININLKGKIIIKEEHDLFNTIPKGFVEVEFESIDFGKKFNVYSNVEEEAFRKIKPQQILEIMRLEEFEEGTLSITLSSSKLYIGYSTYGKTYSAKHFSDVETIDRIINNEVYLVNEFLKLTL